jgi:hypothetical protein
MLFRVTKSKKRAQKTRQNIRNAYKISVGKSKEMRPLRIRRSRWKDNIKTNFYDNARMCTGFNQFRTWPVAGFRENGTERFLFHKRPGI